MRLRLILAVCCGKVAMWLSRILGRGRGSSLPGLVALKICPSIIELFSRQLRRGVVLVTGTNGKTTTNNMLGSILAAAGYKVLINAEGANLPGGVATVFVKSAGLWGKITGDYGLLEIDEGVFPRLARLLQPKVVIITNFFRDQLDRYGELDITIGKITEALKELPDTTIVLNADDPLVAQLTVKTGLTSFFYGLKQVYKSFSYVENVREARFCPLCGSELRFDRYFYGQLGLYKCKGCAFSRPNPDVEVDRFKETKFSSAVHLKHPGGTISFTLPTCGTYNLYNAAAAAAASLLLGLQPEEISRGLNDYMPAIGRMEYFSYRGKLVVLNLVKNPAGFNQALSTILASVENGSDLLIAINDNDADGRDISWLWDVEFEVLESEHDRFTGFICSGLRAEEMALRLKYAGVPVGKITVISDLQNAVAEVLAGPGRTAYLLVTYTALWPAEEILSQRAKRVYVRNVESLPPVS